MTAERFRRDTGKGNRRCSVYHRPRTSTAIPIHFACPSLPSCCLDGLDGAHPSGYWQKVFFISDFFARAVLSVLRQPLYQRPLLPSFVTLPSVSYSPSPATGAKISTMDPTWERWMSVTSSASTRARGDPDSAAALLRTRRRRRRSSGSFMPPPPRVKAGGNFSSEQKYGEGETL